MAVPIAARGLSLAGALTVLGLGAKNVAGFVPDQPFAAGAWLLAGVPFVVFLLWIGLAPRHARRRLHELLGMDLSKPRHIVGLGIHVVFAWIVFAGTVIRTGVVFSRYVETGQHPASSQQLGGSGIVVTLLVSLVLFAIAAVTWLWLVDELDVHGIVDELRLRIEDLPMGVVYGLAATLAGLVILSGMGLALQQLGIEPKNPQADAIASALSPLTAVLVAAFAGMGEELYFRGFLLDRTGNLAQASLFALLHATYLTAFQLVLPFALGLAFGWLVRKTSLWTAVASHTSFNAVMLLIQIYARDGGFAAMLPL